MALAYDDGRDLNLLVMGSLSWVRSGPHPAMPTCSKSVARRIVDRRVLHLIKMWLSAPVEETDDRGRKTRTTEARDEGAGSRRARRSHPCWRTVHAPVRAGLEEARASRRSLGRALVNYADDLVICCRRGNAEEAMTRCGR